MTGKRYDLSKVSNGFTITATKPSELLSPKETMVKQFETGNIFGNEVRILTNYIHDPSR
jgi:hypothetical protein